MRNEADIRREVEARVRRRGLLLLHLLLWAVISLSLFLYSRVQSVPSGWTISAAMIMVIWLLIVGLHGFWVGYVEVRDRAVRSAIEQERQFYGNRRAGEKRKREPLERLAADGELSEDDGTHWEQDDAERNRNTSRG